MNQDLMDWLNGNYKTSSQPEKDMGKNSDGTGVLLLAPISETYPQLDFSKLDYTKPSKENPPEQKIKDEPEKIEHENISQDDQDLGRSPLEIEHEDISQDDQNLERSQIKIEQENISRDDQNSEQPNLEIKQENISLDDQNLGRSPLEVEHENISQDDQDFEHDQIQEQPQNIEDVHEEFIHTPENDRYDDSDSIDIENAYRKNINLDPPTELWTDITGSNNISHVEDNELQRNNKFTDRLQKILQVRRNRAAEIKEHEPDIHKNIYRPRIILLCSFMLIILMGVFGALWLLERNSPDGLNSRAAKLFEAGDYDSATQLYQKGYKLYPNVILFLTGIARSAEHAGHMKTADIAWNEYLKLLPPDETEHRQTALNELERLRSTELEKNNSAGVQTTSQEIESVPENQTALIIPLDPENSANVKKNPLDVKYDFETLIRTGSNFLIKKDFDGAFTSFFDALQLQGDDVRAWLGLADSYRGKGLKNDARRILENARVIFGNEPTIRMALYFLEQEN